MVSKTLESLVFQIFFYTFGLFNWFLYLFLSLRSGAFFKKDTEQDRLQFAIERDRFWNLSKSPVPGFKHYFHVLRNGFRFHYICNKDEPIRNGSLVILLHGFPDSSMIWRHLLQEPPISLQDASFVCVDLPGYGGSDSLAHYDTMVLEALTEFVVAMRDKFIIPENDHTHHTNTVIVGHDWGAVLSFRLAAEAPNLADRFVLTNGPHVELALANKNRILGSSSKIFKQFRQAPRKHSGCLSKSLHTLKPLLIQLLMFGYIFAFNLPSFMVRSLGTAGNFAFLKGAQKISYGRRSKEYRTQESMASSLGPGPEELKSSGSSKTNGVDTKTYGTSVQKRANSPAEAFWNMTGYYRDGVASGPWAKSLEAIADLYTLEIEASESPTSARRRSSSSASSGLFFEQYKSALKAPAIVLWGEKDQACTRPICLDGMGDYLAKDSEIVLLPRTGHWTPVEQESRKALAKVIGLYASKDSAPVPKISQFVEEVYSGATMLVKK